MAMITQNEGATLRDYLAVVHRRRWMIVGTLALMLALAGAASILTPKVFQASAILSADKTPPVVLLDDTRNAVFADQAAPEPPSVATLVEVAKTIAIRDAAAARLAPTIGPTAARFALKRLRVQQIRNADLVRVSVDDPSPEVAAEVANAVAESLVELNILARRQRLTEVREFIGEQLNQAEAKLQSSEEALVVFKQTHAAISLSEDTALKVQKLADLKAQQVDVRLQQREAAARVEAAGARLRRQGAVSPTQWAPNPLIATLQSQLVAAEIEFQTLKQELTPAHPAVISAQAKIEEIRRRLAAELTRAPQPGSFGSDPLYQQLEQQMRQDEVALAALGAREQALSVAIDQYTRVLANIPAQEADLASLTRGAKESEQIVQLLSQKHEEARIAEASVGSAIRIADAARAPEFPIKPRPVLNMVLGGAFGLMTGAAVAFVAEQLDDTVKSAADVERALGVPVLGLIPLEKGTRRRWLRGRRARRLASLLCAGSLGDGSPTMGEATTSDGQSPVVEAFRLLRAQLLTTAAQRQLKCVLISSALPGEGKSSVAAGLALMLAHSGRVVCLIDADLRRSSMSDVFPASDAPGLSGFLSDGSEPDEIITSAGGEPSLFLVRSGAKVPNPGDLLGGPRMTRVVQTSRARAEFVLLDSPPVLPLTDAIALGAHADGVLLVVKAGRTDRRALIEARHRLDQAGIPIVGAALNFVPYGHSDFRYSLRYYHGYMQRNDRARVKRTGSHAGSREKARTS